MYRKQMTTVHVEKPNKRDNEQCVVIDQVTMSMMKMN